jgi:hypothetical protein
MIDEGAWKARAVEGALAYTSKGSDQIAIDFVIGEGPNTGEHITWYGYFTEDTFERTIASLRHMGWGGADLSDLSGIDTQDVRLVVAHEPDLNGELRARVKWVNALSGIAVKERMDVAATKTFAARMKGRILALAAKQPAQRPSPGATAATAATTESANTSDDIPF